MDITVIEAFEAATLIAAFLLVYVVAIAVLWTAYKQRYAWRDMFNEYEACIALRDVNSDEHARSAIYNWVRQNVWGDPLKNVYELVGLVREAEYVTANSSADKSSATCDFSEIAVEKPPAVKVESGLYIVLDDGVFRAVGCSEYLADATSDCCVAFRAWSRNRHLNIGIEKGICDWMKSVEGMK